MSSIQERIETVLTSAEPDVEVLLAEVVGGRIVRLFIDHPEGVSLELCERVTQAARRGPRAVRPRGLLAGHRAPAHQARALPALSSAAARACAPAASTTGAAASPAS